MKASVFVLPADQFGGHELMSIRIAERAMQLGCDVTLMYNKKIERNVQANVNSNLNTIGVNFLITRADILPILPHVIAFLNFMLLLLFYKNTKKKLKSKKIVICNGNLIANFNVVLSFKFIAKLLSAELSVYVPMIHWSKELGLRGLKSALYTWSLRRSAKAATNFIVIGSAWKNRLITLNGRAKCQIISNWIPHDFRDKRKIPAANQGRAPIIAFAGRLDRHHKGLDILVEICAIISARCQISFLIAGDGPDRLWLEGELSKRGLDKLARVEFLGWLDDTGSLFEKADVVVLPSRVEGCPLVLLEALCKGTLAVSFNIPGCDMVLPAQLMAKPFDVEDFCSIVLNVLRGNYNINIEDITYPFVNNQKIDAQILKSFT